jgi:hypothetical protein
VEDKTMKNFDELKVGDWGVDKFGNVVQVREILNDACILSTEYLVSKKGTSGNTPHLLYLIAKPDLTPLPMPKKKIKKWQWIYKSGLCYSLTSGYFANKGEINEHTAIWIESIIEPYLPSQIEVEE